MAQCKKCDKSLPGEEMPACNECLLLSLNTKQQEVYKNFDLSYLSDEETQTKEINGKKFKSKSVYEIKSALRQIQDKTPEKIGDIFVKTLRVKSNTLRDRVLLIDKLTLVFDMDGVAKVPESEKAVIEYYMRARPNRLTWLVDPVVPNELQTQLDTARKALEEYKAQKKFSEVEKTSITKKVSARKTVAKKTPAKRKYTPRKKKSLKKD